mgnify:FL=1
MAILFDTSGLEKRLGLLENKLDIATRMLAETGAINMQSYAQGHAPWTDRTGRARQTLKGSVEPYSSGYKVIIAHGVDYGIWLELAHEKRFAIIPDTLNYGEQKVLPAFERLMDRL